MPLVKPLEDKGQGSPSDAVHRGWPPTHREGKSRQQILGAKETQDLPPLQKLPPPMALHFLANPFIL